MTELEIKNAIAYTWYHIDKALMVKSKVLGYLEDGIYSDMQISSGVVSYISIKGGVVHSNTGPALVQAPYTEFYIDGIEYNFNAWCIRCNIPDNEKLFLKLKYGI